MESNRGTTQDIEAQVTALNKAPGRLLATANERWGKEKVARLHVNKNDAGVALGVLLLGPDICQLMGSQNVKGFGDKVMVFGVATLYGAVHEGKKEVTLHPIDTAKEGANNATAGFGFGVLEASNPVAALAVGIGFGSAFIINQLFANDNLDRNAELKTMWANSGTVGNATLVQYGNRIKELTSADIFHGTYGLATSVAAFKPGHSLAKANELTFSLPNKQMLIDSLQAISKIPSEVEQALIIAVEHNQPLPVLVNVPGKSIAVHEPLQMKRFDDSGKGSHASRTHESTVPHSNPDDKHPTPGSSPESELQTTRAALKAAQEEIVKLNAELKKQYDRMKEEAENIGRYKEEKIFRAVSRQAADLFAISRAKTLIMSAKDVLDCGMSVVKALQEAGMEVFEVPGKPVSFDPSRHAMLNGDKNLPRGQRVTVIEPGISHRGRVIFPVSNWKSELRQRRFVICLAGTCDT